jgi:hypothetical protein
MFHHQRGKHRNPRKITPSVTIENGTRIVINKSCVAYLGSAEHVLLLFDQEKSMVALKGSEKNDNTYRLSKNKTINQASVSVRNFLSQYGISGTRIPAVLADDMVQFCVPRIISNLL